MHILTNHEPTAYILFRIIFGSVLVIFWCVKWGRLFEKYRVYEWHAFWMAPCCLPKLMEVVYYKRLSVRIFASRHYALIVNDKETLYKPYPVSTYDSTKEKTIPADSLDNCKKGYYNYKRRRCGIKNKLRESLRQNDDSLKVKSEMLKHINDNASPNFGFSKIWNLINIFKGETHRVSFARRYA